MAELYNQLASITSSFKSYQESDVNWDEIRNIFYKHNSENLYGICLLHKHYDIFNSEYIVEKKIGKNYISSPEVQKIQNDKYYPSSFRFIKGKLIPHEYTDKKTKPINNKEFIQDLYYYLHMKKLLMIFGIFINVSREKGVCYLEHTKGRQNIASPCPEKDTKTQEHIPTNWLLTNDVNKRCKAIRYCNIEDDTHMSHYVHEG